MLLYGSCCAGLAAGHGFGRARLDVAGSIRRGDSEFENGFFDSDEVVAKLELPVGGESSVGLVASVAVALLVHHRSPSV